LRVFGLKSVVMGGVVLFKQNPSALLFRLIIQ
jgi:hypothetical protein